MFPARFTERARMVINYANDEAIRLNHSQVDTEHLLLGLVREGEGIAAKALQDLGVSLERLEMEAKRMIRKSRTPTTDSIKRPLVFTRAANQVLQLSMEEAQRLEYEHVGTEHILLGLIREKNGIAAQTLTNFDITLEKVRKALRPFISNPSPKKSPKAVDQYSRDLTQLARENLLDPIIGRENEMERVMQILIRRKKNNPVLIGEPGVGKTAIAEGMAQKIIEGCVPDSLLDKRLVTLDLAGLVAGTKYRGQFEERLKNIMNEIRQSKDIILFIDEIHTLVGTGAAEGAIDAANMLKPALSRGEIQCIGATTLDEYRKYIEKDGALERRFQIVNVAQPSVKDTIMILNGLKDKYEEHHSVEYSKESLSEAAKLSARYISDRYLPDKAIDVIDEAGSRVRMRAGKEECQIAKTILNEDIDESKKVEMDRDHELATSSLANIRIPSLVMGGQEPGDDDSLNQSGHASKREKLKVDIEDIAEVISKWTGIPISKLEETESEKLLRMEDALCEQVIGQDQAISALVKAVRRSRAGLKDPTKPIGSFIFMGPTGVGKSYLANVLAEFLFGEEDAIIRIDMSEFMEKFAVSRLVGAPPGYVGYQEGGELTERVRRRPYSVILLDEIEKAHPDVFNILLQVLDSGRLTDNLGHTVDFRNTILIMTSNAGGREIAKGSSLGFSHMSESKSYEDMRSRVMSEMKRVFNPEFLNRIDEVIVFNSLAKEHISKITLLMLDEVKERLKENQVDLVVLSDAVDFIVEKGYDPHFGARHLRREIQRNIEDTIAHMMIEGSATENTIYVSFDGEKLVFNIGEPVTCASS
ncbi:AAA domain-containing protein [Candidatus Poribacteria bacterium]|nr:AAA domain-containing protein [Candidatus Poribacteria bacterium]